MATGESLRSLSFGFRLCHTYISRILKKTLAVLKAKLIPIFLKDPKNVDFKGKAAEFSCKWNFPNCILAIDGKHIRIRNPKNSEVYFIITRTSFPLCYLQWLMQTINLL